MKNVWTNTDRILYGIMAGGVVLWAVSQFIEACRSRPKVEMIVLGFKQQAKSGQDESSSAAE